MPTAKPRTKKRKSSKTKKKLRTGAHALLYDAVKDYGGVAKVAERLDCTRQCLYALTEGGSKQVPKLATAIAIEDLLDIPVRAWVEK